MLLVFAADLLSCSHSYIVLVNIRGSIFQFSSGQSLGDEVDDFWAQIS